MIDSTNLPMNNLPTISFATTVWNEHEELDRLLIQLLSIISPDDEIVIQGDQGRVTDSVVSVLHKYRKNPQIKYIEYPLKKDFSTFKNNLFKNCEKDYVFNIDADETLCDELASMYRDIIAMNSDVDVFAVPRINVVTGLTTDHVQKWGWRIDTNGWVNFPDYQCRIVRNHAGIKWINSVHEILSNYKVQTALPARPEYALIHAKSIDRQTKQNDFYSTFKGQ